MKAPLTYLELGGWQKKVDGIITKCATIGAFHGKFSEEHKLERFGIHNPAVLQELVAGKSVFAIR
jgi:hypothetical protein